MTLFRGKNCLNQSFPAVVRLEFFREQSQAETFCFFQQIRVCSENILRVIIKRKRQKTMIRFHFPAVAHHIDDLHFLAFDLKADQERLRFAGCGASVPQ